MRVSRADLDWWLRKANSLRWKRASTYEEFAPHEYIVPSMHPHMHRDDWVRAAAVIMAFGTPGRFNRWANVYLHDPETGLKYWTMDKPISTTGIVNRDPSSSMYGVQDAPDLGTCDCDAPVDVPLTQRHLGERLTGWLRATYRGDPQGPPTVLDVECGDGVLLESPTLSSNLYTGVSVNRSHLALTWFYRGGKVALHCGDWREIPLTAESRRYRLVTYVNPDAPVLTNEDLDRLLARRVVGGVLVVRTDKSPVYGGSGTYQFWGGVGSSWQ